MNDKKYENTSIFTNNKIILIALVLTVAIIFSAGLASYVITNETIKSSQSTISQWKKTITYYNVLTMAELGDSQSQYTLGLMYFRGNIIPRDDKLSIYWTEKAAAQGMEMAQYNLALAYLKGYAGLKPDANTIIELLNKPAKNNPNAQAVLGMIYLQGKLLPRDEKLGCAWSLQAAENGVAGAAYNLGICYLEGKGGLSKDKIQARLWLEKAAAGNIRESREVLSKLAQASDVKPKKPRVKVAKKMLDEGMIVDFNKDLHDDPVI